MEHILTIGLAISILALIFIAIDWSRIKKTLKLNVIHINELSEKTRKLLEENNLISNNLELTKQRLQFINDEKTQLSKEFESLKQNYHQVLEREQILNNQVNELRRNNQKLNDDNTNISRELELSRQKIQFLIDEKSQVLKDNDYLKQQLSILKEKEKEETVSIAKYESQVDSLRSQVSKDSNRLPEILIEQNENLKQVFAVIAKLQQDIIYAKQQTINAHESKGVLETLGKGLDKATDKIRNFLNI
jgi:chromosome segregation ATPase